MSDIDPEISAAAVAAIERLSRTGTETQKTHFTQMITLLADCYGPESKNKGVLLLHNDDEQYTVFINADPWEAAGLVQHVYDEMNLAAFQKAPTNLPTH